MADLDDLIGNTESALVAELAELKQTRTNILTGGQGFQKKEFQINQVEFRRLEERITLVESRIALLKVNEL
jgi:hypothetical protein